MFSNPFSKVCSPRSDADDGSTDTGYASDGSDDTIRASRVNPRCGLLTGQTVTTKKSMTYALKRESATSCLRRKLTKSKGQYRKPPPPLHPSMDDSSSCSSYVTKSTSPTSLDATPVRTKSPKCKFEAAALDPFTSTNRDQYQINRSLLASRLRDLADQVDSLQLVDDPAVDTIDFWIRGTRSVISRCQVEEWRTAIQHNESGYYSEDVNAMGFFL